MNSNNSFSDFHQIVEIAETMKERIIKNFKVCHSFRMYLTYILGIAMA